MPVPSPSKAATEAAPVADLVRRRRRRTPDAPPEPPPARGVRVRRRGWSPAAWATAPTFRVLLFLGGILAVMGFLLYNEYMIREFRAQERSRAQLYANMYGLAISDAVPQVISGRIFQDIMLDDSIAFPIIVTDHRGGILHWKGPGLPPATAERSAGNLEALLRAVRDMDAVNDPIHVTWYPEARVRAYVSGASLILGDPVGYAAAWSGPELPASADTTAAVRQRVDAELRAWREQQEPAVTFVLPAREPHHLVHVGEDFAVARQRAVVAWGGPSLPDFAPAADAGPAQALYDDFAASRPPVVFEVHNEHIIHYGNTELISRISVAPFVTVGVLLLFVAIGWVGSRNIRRSEQHLIWVGMAKETAHQLGTPLSSLSGWLELMGSRVRELASGLDPRRAEAAASVQSAVDEMQKDMGRLTQIASRFSQIGSVPELESGDVRDVIDDTITYFTDRGSQFGRHRFVVDLDEVPPLPLNAELMGWAFENLIKNAMDAMVQKEGTIRVSARHDADAGCVRIRIEDDGRGIEPENLARVFQPGFSTKKRGWGLGLAFVRRIVEEYHGGRIHIPRSEPGVGTLFEIDLPDA